SLGVGSWKLEVDRVSLDSIPNDQGANSQASHAETTGASLGVGSWKLEVDGVSLDSIPNDQGASSQASHAETTGASAGGGSWKLELTASASKRSGSAQLVERHRHRVLRDVDLEGPGIERDVGVDVRQAQGEIRGRAAPGLGAHPDRREAAAGVVGICRGEGRTRRAGDLPAAAGAAGGRGPRAGPPG